MTVRNKTIHVGSMSGSNEGSRQPPPGGSLEPEFFGVPDVSFGDTSLPVFSESYQVTGTWNMPVTGLVPQTGGPVSAGVGSTTVSWQDERGMQGSVDITHFDGSNATGFSIVFPLNSNGVLRVSINKNSVVSALDNRTLGPPSSRFFTVEYDTRPEIDIPDNTPATLTLSEPSTRGKGTWKQSTYNQRFVWSKPVSDFDETDVFTSVAGSGSVSRGDLVKDEDDNKRYSMVLSFSGSGTFNIAVPENSAQTGDETDSPPNDVSSNWAFAQEDTFTIAGVTELCSETYDITSHPEMIDPTEGGSFLGISDLEVYDGRVYGVSQIQRKREGKDEVSIVNPSAGALFSVPTGGGTCVIHKKYPIFVQAARSLTKHNGDLYFFEGCHYVYPKVPRGLDEGKLGFVQRIDSAQTIIEQVGLNWSSGFPTGVFTKHSGVHGATRSPMVSHDDDLHIVSEKSNISDINGSLWIVYGEKLNQRLPVLRTNGETGFQILEQIAGLSNSILGFNAGRFIFKPRRPVQAFLNRPRNSSQRAILYKDPNREHAIPQSGVMLIDDELIEYPLINSVQSRFNAVNRGSYGTTATSHDANAPIVFIDKVIDAFTLARPINEMDIETDGTLIYNNILTKYAENQVPRTEFLQFSAADSDSITAYGENKFELELPLDYHQQNWATHLARELLGRFKDPQPVVSLTLKRDFDLELGDVLYLIEPILSDTSLLCQVMSLSQNKDDEETDIVVVGISPATL